MALLPLTEEHLELILEWRNASSIREKMYHSHIISWEEHCAWFERVKGNETCKWFLYHGENRSPEGVVGFTDINDRNRSAFWGFYVTENSLPGVGTKMGYEALEKVFKTYKLHKLNSEILAVNEKSIHYHEKLGFLREGVLRDFHFNGTEYINVVRMGIIESEWLEKRKSILDKITMNGKNAKISGEIKTVR